MRYVSDEKELRKISIYTNIESVKKVLKNFFIKKKQKRIQKVKELMWR